MSILFHDTVQPALPRTGVPPSTPPAAASRTTSPDGPAAYPPVRWLGEVTGGIAGAIVSVTLALTLGLLAFAPLGAAYAGVGIYAGLVSAIYGQLVAGAFGSSPYAGSVPRASTSLLLAGLVAVLAGDPALAPSAAQGAGPIVALTSLCVLLSGVFQLLFTWLRIGQISRYVPYPFVAGFMCGISVLVLIAQFRPIMGFEPATLLQGPYAVWQALEPATLFVGAVTAAVIFAFAAKVKRVPAVLAGVVAGTALYYAFRTLLPQVAVGDVVGPVSDSLPAPTALFALFDLPAGLLQKHLPGVVVAAAVVAVIGTLDTMFAVVAVDHATDGRHSNKRELFAHGLANIVAGACGGVPVVYSNARALASFDAGGRTKRTLAIAVALVAALLLAGDELIASVPFVVLAGIMITIAVGLVDRWVRGMILRLPADAQRRDPTRMLSVATVLVVAVATVVYGFIPALVTGLTLSMLLLAVSLNRSLVRNVVDGTVRPSRRVWGPADAGEVWAARKRIRIVELEGSVFFGSAERLAEEVEPLGGEVDAVVLDFRHVNGIDATGALLIERLTRRLEHRGTLMLLAGVTPDGRLGKAFVAHNAFVGPGERHWFRDADKAVEWVEHRALEAAGRVRMHALELSEFALLRGLAAAELAIVSKYAARRTIPRGQVLFREGDPGEALYLLALGAIEISIEVGEGRRSRIVTMAPGSLFGEAALLDGRPRSATAVATEPSVLYELSRSVLQDELARSHPDITIRLLENLARNMSARMRETNEILRRLEDSLG